MQGYAMIVGERITVKRAQEILGIGSSRVARARGSAESNRTYCTKVGSRIAGPWEFGVFENQQGVRTDLEEAATMTMAQVDKRLPRIAIQYGRGIQARRDRLNDIPESEKWEVHVVEKLPEGLGETFYIKTAEKDRNEYGVDYKWNWTNYDFQKDAYVYGWIVPDWKREVEVWGRGHVCNKVRRLWVIRRVV